MAQIKKNTSTPNRRMIGEVHLNPDFDTSFSAISTPTYDYKYESFATIGLVTNDLGTYEFVGGNTVDMGNTNTEGEEFYTPSIGSFFIDCSLIGNPAEGASPQSQVFKPTPQRPVLVEVPLVEGGFGRFATSSFTPEAYGVSGSVPQQQSYNDVFNRRGTGLNNMKLRNVNARRQRHSIELTYTVIRNGLKNHNAISQRTSPKHKTIISTWGIYGMQRLTTDGNGNVVLPEDANIMCQSYIHRGYDLSSGDVVGDTQYDYGGIGTEFHQIADPYYGVNVSTPYNSYSEAQDYRTILDNEIPSNNNASAAYLQDGEDGVLYNTNPNATNYFFPPRVIASSRINPSPNYLQLTPVFQFFLANNHCFVKGHYKIY